MLKSHEKFHSANGKRQILVVDDEFINRELLKAILADDYEILTAEDGLSALNIIKANSSTLSLVMLDLLMPVMPGKELLRRIKEDKDTQNIPVIIMTSDQQSEIECLDMGAVDFIPKPYPDREIILARVRRTIELYEDRQIIMVTERDELTGLYNVEYFYRYAEQYDMYHADRDMDAIVVDINHFHMMNERFGREYSDEVLKKLGGVIRDYVGKDGGIVCRREADTFLAYCPHMDDYSPILTNVASAFPDDENAQSRIRMRIGVYPSVDKSLEIERRFDHAKMAADKIRNSMSQSIAMYDRKLHESELYDEQLIDDFKKAIDEHQFTVYYQPKFDVRPEIPVLASAEALVRWEHPTLGFISPGSFISLFEENGLIRELDAYVWREAAAQIKDWKDRFGISVPVSVNVSRVDMYDQNILENFEDLLREFSLDPSELLLEITESAYTEDSEQIISTVNRFREHGFKIEMDDFGTGYSSLNMISSLPIDALKLDMRFIRRAFQEEKDTKMIEIIIDIADYLEVPVIAEGVETEEQLKVLRTLGCDIVQGYYFSKPLKASDYDRYVEERKRQSDAVPAPEKDDSKFKRRITRPHELMNIAHALTSGYECIYYVDTVSGQYVQFSVYGKYEDLQIASSGTDFFGDTQKNIGIVVFGEDRQRVSLCMEKETLLAQLMTGQHFTMTYRLLINGVPTYYNLRAVRPGAADRHIVIGVSNLESDVSGGRDFYSVAYALSSDFDKMYSVDLRTDSYTEYTRDALSDKISEIGQGEDFFGYLGTRLKETVAPGDLEAVRNALSRENLLRALTSEKIFTVIYGAADGGEKDHRRVKAVLSADDDSRLVIGISAIDAQTAGKELAGASDGRSNRDALTGVKNRRSYMEAEAELNRRIKEGGQEEFAVAVCDINGLKSVNDELGHTAGDSLIRSASSIICNTFKRSPVFRIGGDEFAVLLMGSDFENRRSLAEAMSEKNTVNKQTGEVVVAMGMADFDPAADSSVSDVFERADAEMYRDKAVLKDG